MKKSSALLIACALLFAVPAFAKLSLRQKSFAKLQDKYFAKEIELLDRRCGTKIDAKIVWESFKGEIDKKLDGKLNRSFSGYCGSALNAMGHLCTSDDAKSAVRSGVKSYRCVFGGKGKRNITLKNSTLTMSIDWEAANYDQYVSKFLGKKL